MKTSDFAIYLVPQHRGAFEKHNPPGVQNQAVASLGVPASPFGFFFDGKFAEAGD